MEEWQKFISGRWKGLVREGWQDVFSDIRLLADSGKVITYFVRRLRGFH